MLYLVTLILLVIAMLLTLLRIAKGPSLWDRVLSVNAFTTQTLLLIAVYLFATQQSDYIDIALLYALVSYLGNLALVKLFIKRQN